MIKRTIPGMNIKQHSFGNSFLITIGGER